jgi:nitrite reductase (NADH) small subunit
MKELPMEITLGPITAIPAGEGRNFQVGADQIAVFRSRQDGVFATQAECPHRKGPLADGLLGDGTLICPLHSMKFNLSTGQAEGGECALRIYPARLSDSGQILVELKGAP